MSDSPNVSVVRRLYQARGNPDIIRQVLAREVRWEVVDGFPYGGVYVGLDSVLGDFFGRLLTDFDEFVADGSEFSSPANASSPSAAIRGAPGGAATGSPLVSLTCGRCKAGGSCACSNAPIPFSWLAPWPTRSNRSEQGMEPTR